MNTDITRLIRPELTKLKEYAAVEPAEFLGKQIGIAADAVIKLDDNVNPYGCSPRVFEALVRHPRYHTYPDPEQRTLREALSAYVQMPADNIIAGSGSDELIDLLLRLIVKPGDKVLNCPPTFGMYPFCTEVCGGEVVDLERKSDFSLDINAMKSAVDERTKAVFIASPNNPTGNLADEHEIAALLDLGILVVVDEAYFEFSGMTYVRLVNNWNNLVILRTFSKWAGLAGLRAGYGIMSTELVRYLMKIKQPYNLNTAAEAAIIASLADEEKLKQVVSRIVVERERLLGKLQGIKWLQPYPSYGNFIFCRVLDRKAVEIHNALMQKGVFVRHYSTSQAKDFIRVSVGKPGDTDGLIAAMRGL